MSDCLVLPATNKPLDWCAREWRLPYSITSVHACMTHCQWEQKHTLVSVVGSPLALFWRRKVASYCSESGWRKCEGTASAQDWVFWFWLPPTREHAPSLGGSQRRLDPLHSWWAGRSPGPIRYLNKRRRQSSLSLLCMWHFALECID